MVVRWFTGRQCYDHILDHCNPVVVVRMIIGDRVEIAPRFDDWMRGDRYGEIVGFRHQRLGGEEAQTYVQVQLDKSGKKPYYYPRDLTLVEDL